MSARTTPPRVHSTAATIRTRIDQGGERLWRFDDFSDLSTAAVAQALSRLARQRVLRRLSKGVYYRSRPTSLGPSTPNPAAIHELAARRKAMFPAGLAAASLLGFTTQVAGRKEIATNATSLPRKLVGADAAIHTRRPSAWAGLTQTEAALLDVLRRGGRTSELPPAETARRLVHVLRHPRRFERLLEVAATEPPRVRAILGAVGEALGKATRVLNGLRASLNPLSRYDFGNLDTLPTARNWQAKKSRAS